MKNMIRPFLWVLLLTISWITFAQDIPDKPVPPRLVNDFAGILDPGDAANLERTLVAFNDSTSTQIAVVIVSSLHGYDKADYAQRIGEKWGVGQKGKSNGIVVLVKPKTAEESGEAYIATGYGLEGIIPDAIGKRIVEQEMIPSFKNNDYYGGLVKGTKVLMELSQKEYSSADYEKRTTQNPYGIFIPIIIIILVLFFIRASRAKSMTLGKSIPFWTAFWLASSLGNKGHSSGHWGGFSGGSGFGGGGGFGGFGGGSFGGGGAGGSW